MLCGVGIGWCQIPQGFAHGGRDLESLTRRERLQPIEVAHASELI